LKFFQIEIPGINYPKLINIECSSKEGIYLTNLYNSSKEKKYISQFRNNYIKYIRRYNNI
jgi:hypothetical protein